MKIKVLHRFGEFLARRQYVKKAIEDKADLSDFKQKPTPRILLGLFLIGFSYVLGWPAVAFFGYLAFYFKEPLWAIIGCPGTYGLSHGVFWAGVYLAGIKYTKALFRWAARMLAERLLRF